MTTIQTRTTPTTIEPSEDIASRAPELSPIAIGLDGQRSHPVAGALADESRDEVPEDRRAAADDR